MDYFFDPFDHRLLVILLLYTNVDNDIAARLEDLRKSQGLSLKQAVNLLLRDGLEAHSTPLRAQGFRTEPRELGLRAGFDPGKLNQLVDELDAEARMAKTVTEELLFIY